MVAFLVLRRQDSAADRPPADAPSPVTAPAPRDADSGPPPPRPTVPPTATALAAPVAEAGQGEALPVRFFFRAAHNDIAATVQLMNLSNDRLEIAVTAVNGKTNLRSVATVSARPHQRINLLLSGLQVGTGDRLTFRSPPFADQTVLAQ